ncbi:MAG: hypothetical protein M9938_07090 [Solirubrobacterales bacterium]|nr:hypothetical protein [Solirubrobacterales bacterium]
MKLKTKLGAFVAAAAVACAIGVAPAQAGSAHSLPSPGELSGLCGKTKNAKLGSLCAKGVEAYNACSSQTSSKGLAACLASAAKGIVGSGVPVKGNTAGILDKLKSLAGGKLGGLNLGGIDLNSILGKLGGAGGLNLGSLLSKGLSR